MNFFDDFETLVKKEIFSVIVHRTSKVINYIMFNRYHVVSIPDTYY